MTRDELCAAVLGVLLQVAPELDATTVDPQADLQEEYDLDSMDFLNFVIGLHEITGIEIPEGDYPRLLSIDACVDYLGTDS